MPAITTNSSTDEVFAILASYGINAADGLSPEERAQLEVISTAIQTGGDGTYDDLDLLTAYVTVTNELPPWMLDESYAVLADPSAHPTLWEDDFESNLRQLGDLPEHAAIQDPVNSFISALMTRRDEIEGAADGDFLDRVEAFLSSAPEGDDPATADPTAAGILDLFAAADLMEIATLMISLGNPGLALLMYIASGLTPAMRELQTIALDIIEESGYTIEDLVDQLEDIMPDDPTAQADAERVRQQLQVVQTVISTMTQFMSTAQEMIESGIEAATQMEDSRQRTDESLVRAI